MAIGFTVLAALFILFLRRMVALDLPVVGEYIWRLFEIVSEQQNFR